MDVAVLPGAWSVQGERESLTEVDNKHGISPERASELPEVVQVTATRARSEMTFSRTGGCVPSRLALSSWMQG
jgi:hypothetical protein